MPRMKRLTPVAAFLFCAAMALQAADVIETPFMPMIPGVMGQGGAATASARGWDSFFTNPAGFSREGGTFTVLEAGAWMYARPDRALALVQEYIAGGASAGLFSLINDEITSGGFGIGASTGIGYAAKGLGLGHGHRDRLLLLGSHDAGHGRRRDGHGGLHGRHVVPAPGGTVR